MTDGNQERLGVGHAPQCTVYHYVSMEAKYLDVIRFRDVRQGPQGERIYINGRIMWCMGEWMELWGHWTTSVFQFYSKGIFYMTFVRNREEWTWQDEFRP